MANRTFFTLENGPDRELAEQGVYRRGALIPRTSSGTSGITPTTGGVLPPRPSIPLDPRTGGPLPPRTGINPTTGGPLPPSSGTGINPQTGGPLPPIPVPAPPPTGATTGGPLPPSRGTPVPPNANTGGGLPPRPGLPVNPTTGGPLPPNRLPIPNGNTGGPLPPSAQASGFSPVDVVNQMVEGLMNGRIGQNARQRGLEFANSRGMLNSSLAAGSAERATLEALNPYVSEGMGVLRQREQNAFEGEQADKKVFQQDWLTSRDFNRQFYGALSMIPINNAQQFSQMISQYALENPEIYTPDNIAGMSKFFNDNFRYLMSQYLGDIDLGGL